MRCVPFVIVLCAGVASATDFTQIDESYFAGSAVVGVDAIGDVLGTPLTVGFDFAPDGTPIDTPTQIPGSSLFASGSLASVFAPVGLQIDSISVAVSQPSNPSGIGAMSGPNTLASEASRTPDGTIEFTFANGALAAGFWAVDGPVNNVSASFYDVGGNLITTLDGSTIVAYLGIESDTPIGRIEISTSAADDYFVEDLSFVNVPAPAAAGAFALAGLACVRRRR